LTLSVQNISTIAGIGQNAGTATNLLNDLSGSLSNAFQTYNSPGGATPGFLPGQTRYRNWLQREYSGFFKDDFKLKPSLTLSAGLRYEFYGVPTENQGKMLAPVGSGSAVFGISGSTFASEFQPGAASGTPTRIQEIGDGTPNPKTALYNPDRNNFAPALQRLPLYLIHNNSGLDSRKQTCSPQRLC
jgi:hypothetical protein